MTKALHRARDKIRRLSEENKIMVDALEYIEAGDIFPMAYESNIATDALDLVLGKQR